MTPPFLSGHAYTESRTLPGRLGAGAALRRRPLLPQRALPDRDRPPRHRPQPRLPLRARDERLRREVHPDAQGAAALDRTLPDARAATPQRARLRPPLQRALVARTPRLPHTDRSPPAPARSGSPGMIRQQSTKVSGELGAVHGELRA